MKCIKCGKVLTQTEIDSCELLNKDYYCLDHRLDAPTNDPVNHPPHYIQHPSGVECITITEYMNFCLGNCIKYIWRASLKGDQLENLKKAQFYLNREITRIENEQNKKPN